MCKKLPLKNFKWINPNDYDEEMIKNHDENSDYGLSLEVDVKYPNEIALKHEDLGFLAVRKKIGKVEKLVTTLNNKKKYVVHISALKQALNYGLKLEKIHRIIGFKQKGWLKPYILMNNEHGTNAKNEFENFFKLINNSVFGKTMENIREHKDIKLVNAREKLNRYVREPNLKNIKYFRPNLLAIEMRKTEITMNKPVYLGQAVLDISKTLMYEFYYGYLKQKHGDKVKLCYTDTDS